MKKIMIDILKELTGEERITREGGEKLRNRILAGPHPVTVDFQDKPIASVSFWDESIAKLVLQGWSEVDIKKNVVLKNVHPRDVEVLQKLIEARSKT
jgi:hypothetical protein